MFLFVELPVLEEIRNLLSMASIFFMNFIEPRINRNLQKGLKLHAKIKTWEQ